MGYMAPKLKQRIQIQTSNQEPNNRGGFDITYTTLTTIWARISHVSNTSAKFVRAIMFQNANPEEIVTHEFTVRLSAIKYFGKQVSGAFDSAFDNIEDLAPLKNEYFLFLQKGSTVKGRRFRIISIQRDDAFSELMKIGVKELEESGTGAQEGYE